MAATRESAALAEVLIHHTCARYDISLDQLTFPADRSSSMALKSVTFLLADLGATQSNSRQHISDDSRFSKTHFRR